MLDQVKAERKGKPLADTAQSRLRMAFLRGERLSNREVPAQYGVSMTAINGAIRDLKRVGYEFEREESPETGAVYWIANPRHVPKEDTGPTRQPPNRRSKKAATVKHGASERPQRTRRAAEEPIGLSQTFTVVRAQIDQDGSISYTLRRDDGKELLGIERDR